MPFIDAHGLQGAAARCQRQLPNGYPDVGGGARTNEPDRDPALDPRQPNGAPYLSPYLAGVFETGACRNMPGGVYTPPKGPCRGTNAVFLLHWLDYAEFR